MSQPTRAEVMRAFIPASPFAQELGIELVDLRLDHAELRLPWAPRLATLGDVVHGGAIAALLDTAGMAAAWSDDVVPEKPAGATVSMSVSYTAAAVASDLTAHATVVRRGRSLCFCEVTVSDAEGRSSPTGRWSTATAEQPPRRHQSPDALEQQEAPQLLVQREPGEHRRAGEVEHERRVRARRDEAELHGDERGEHRERAGELERIGHESSFARRRQAGYGAPSRPGMTRAGHHDRGWHTRSALPRR